MSKDAANRGLGQMGKEEEAQQDSNPQPLDRAIGMCASAVLQPLIMP